MTARRSALAGWSFESSSATGTFDPPWLPARFDGRRWESGPVEVPEATGLAISWNARTPRGAGIAFAVSIRISGTWSPWTPMGEWGAAPAPTHPAGPVRRNVDVASWGGTADAVRVCADIFPNESGEMPGLRRIVLATDVPDENAPCPGAPSPGPVVRTIPFRSQMTESPEIARRICGPTSLAMYLATSSPGIITAETAAAAYDDRHDIYGNWARLVALAGEAGHVAWIERFSCLADVERRIAAGYGAILSVAYEEGELAGSPLARTGGHLIVLRGWDANGDPVCNDPAFPDARGDGVVYRRCELERAWSGHGGATILLRPG